MANGMCNINCPTRRQPRDNAYREKLTQKRGADGRRPNRLPAFRQLAAFLEAGASETASELVAVIAGRGKTIEVSLLELDFPYHLDFGSAEGLDTELLCDFSHFRHLHEEPPFVYIMSGSASCEL